MPHFLFKMQWPESNTPYQQLHDDQTPPKKSKQSSARAQELQVLLQSRGGSNGNINEGPAAAVPAAAPGAVAQNANAPHGQATEVGLALSGGGIRSAAFGMGVLKKLLLHQQAQQHSYSLKWLRYR